MLQELTVQRDHFMTRMLDRVEMAGKMGGLNLNTLCQEN